MMLTILTIVLNGQPYIEHQLSVFRRLTVPWRWHVVEGVSSPVGCTAWCSPVGATWHRNWRSIDGTSEVLDGIADHRVRVSRPAGPWPGKLAMISEAMRGVDHGVVMQIDADEFWMPAQLDDVYRRMITAPIGTAAQFRCFCFVGPRKAVTSRIGFASMPYEWVRAWKIGPGVRFVSHEPPTLNIQRQTVPRDVTAASGLVFQHYAYGTAEQARFKEEFYGYRGLVDGWNRLQQTKGEVRLGAYFPFLKDQPWVTANDV